MKAWRVLLMAPGTQREREQAASRQGGGLRRGPTASRRGMCLSAHLKLGRNIWILGAQAGLSRGISRQHTGPASPRAARPARPRAGSVLQSSTAAVALPAPGAAAPPSPPPRAARRWGRSHQLVPFAAPPSPPPPRSRAGCCTCSASCGSGSALKAASREGRPTDEMPWSRASLQAQRQLCKSCERLTGQPVTAHKGAASPHAVLQPPVTAHVTPAWSADLRFCQALTPGFQQDKHDACSQAPYTPSGSWRTPLTCCSGTANSLVVHVHAGCPSA